MKATITTKLTALFASNNMEFSPDCAEAGAAMHRVSNQIVDAANLFGQAKNEEDTVSSIVAGVLELEGETPNYLDFAQNMMEAGISLDGFVKGWNAGITTMEKAGYNVTPPFNGNRKRKSAIISKQDKLNTLKPIWTGIKKGKRKPRTMEQIVASLVKEHGKKAVARAVENAK